MPDLYHVFNGIELFIPKFNVVPPGVNENVFFPNTRQEERINNDRQRLEDLLFTLEDPEQVFGKLNDPNKRPIFSMARLDRIKNLTLSRVFWQNQSTATTVQLNFSSREIKNRRIKRP